MKRRPTPSRGLGSAAPHVRRDGRPKAAYRTDAEARQAAQAAWAIEGVALNAYRCPVCHQWHIGKRFRDD